MGQEEEVKEEVEEDQETIAVKIDIEGKGRKNYLETFHCSSSSSSSRREEREQRQIPESGRQRKRRLHKEMPGGKHLYDTRGVLLRNTHRVQRVN